MSKSRGQIGWRCRGSFVIIRQQKEATFCLVACLNPRQMGLNSEGQYFYSSILKNLKSSTLMEQAQNDMFLSLSKKESKTRKSSLFKDTSSQCNPRPGDLAYLQREKEGVIPQEFFISARYRCVAGEEGPIDYITILLRVDAPCFYSRDGDAFGRPRQILFSEERNIQILNPIVHLE